MISPFLLCSSDLMYMHHRFHEVLHSAKYLGENVDNIANSTSNRESFLIQTLSLH